VPTTFTLEETTIDEIHAAFGGKALTCVELVQGYLDRIAAYDQKGPALNSYITVNPAALTEAADRDAAFRKA
jgi:amidase